MRTVAPSFFTPDRTLSESFLLSLVDSNLTEHLEYRGHLTFCGCLQAHPTQVTLCWGQMLRSLGHKVPHCLLSPTWAADAGLVLTVQVPPPHKLHHSLLNLAVYTLQVPATDLSFPPNIRRSHCTFSFLIRSKSSDCGWKLFQQHMKLPLNKQLNPCSTDPRLLLPSSPAAVEKTSNSKPNRFFSE